jgi:nitrogen-specific signal transduction histidine kinase
MFNKSADIGAGSAEESIPVSTKPSIIAHHARNALTALHGRLQLIRRRVHSESYERNRVIIDLDLALERADVLAELIDALAAAAQPCSPTDQDPSESP